MFVRIQIYWTDHFEVLRVKVFEIQVEVQPYNLSTLNLTHSIVIHKCLACATGTIIFDH